MKFSSTTLVLLTASLAAALPTQTSGISIEAAATSSASGQDLQTQEDDSSASNSGVSGKRGIPYNNENLVHLFPSKVVNWAYNWASSPQGSLPNGYEYVPMLYNGNDPSWDANVEKALKSGSKHLLAMNEPDQPTSVGGTQISPGSAAQIYKNKMNKYKGRAKLGAPAVSAGGIGWLQEFAQACNGGCHIDFVPLHFYNSDPNPNTQAVSMKGFLEENIPKVRSMFKNNNLPIWVTEFAAIPDKPINDQTSITFMNDILSWLDNNNNIARYSYFYADVLASNGKLNAAGKRYIQ